MKNDLIVYNTEVKTALAKKKPIVALESTLISFGLPQPENLETALDIEEIIRSQGAIPATIAVIDGKMHVGLNKDQLKFLATSDQILKCTTADIPFYLNSKSAGATTVASTIFISKLAGIKIMATGGIGGVHIGASTSFDVSADLDQLSKTDVTIVCSGAKSILDIGKTLEYLETVGVPVIGFKTNQFPAFYCLASGYSVNYRLDDILDIAKIININKKLGLENGFLIANPIPANYALSSSDIDQYIIIANRLAVEQNIYGKKLTPFLLNEMNRLSGNKTLKSNIQLVLSNAKLAAQLAKLTL